MILKPEQDANEERVEELKTHRMTQFPDGRIGVITSIDPARMEIVSIDLDEGDNLRKGDILRESHRSYNNEGAVNTSADFEVLNLTDPVGYNSAYAAFLEAQIHSLEKKLERYEEEYG